MISIPDDVLWQIFSQFIPEHPISSYSVNNINTWRLPLESGGLATAKSTSQVSRQWRRVITSFPYLWSRMLDLTVLSNYRQPVQSSKIILLRAQGRNLHLHGAVTSVRGMWCFLELIRGCWNRVEIVHVRLRMDASSTTHDFTGHTAWSTIRDEVSTALQHFYLLAEVTLLLPYNIEDDDVMPEYICLKLNKHNPNVRYLFVEGPLQFSFQPNAPLFHNLRILTISVPVFENHFDNGTFPCGIEDLFAILEGAPLLEILSIGRLVVREVTNAFLYEQHPKLQLNQLQYLELHADISVCLSFLFHLSPALACGLDLRCGIQSDVSTRCVDTLHGLVRDWQTKHTSPMPNTEQSLRIHLSRFNPQLNRPSPSHSSSFRFQILRLDDGDDTEWGTTGFRFVESLVNNDFDFSAVTSLRLTIQNAVCISFSIPQLHALLAKFPHLRTLTINWEQFDRFHARLKSLTNSSGIVFPHLEELVISDTHQMSELDPLVPASAVIEFCKTQRELSQSINTDIEGTPFKRLNVRGADIKVKDAFLQSVLFEGLDGLEVVYDKAVETDDCCLIGEQLAVIESGVITDVVEVVNM